MVNPHALAAASGLPGYGPPRATNANNGFGPAINPTNGSLSTVRISKYLAATKNNYGSDDTRADAVLKHMTQVPNMSSVRYQSGQYIPDCTDKVSISPGIDACISDLQEEHNEIRRLTIVLTSRKKTVAQITEFIEECDRAHQLEMSNKLANLLCVFEQVDVMPGNGRGLPLGMKARAPPHLTFSKNAFVTNRTLGNVFFEQRNNLQQRLDFFQSRKVSQKPYSWLPSLPSRQGREVMGLNHRLLELQSSALPTELTPLRALPLAGLVRLKGAALHAGAPAAWSPRDRKGK